MTDEKTDLDRIEIGITGEGDHVAFVAKYRGETWGRRDLRSRFDMPENDDQLRAFLGRVVGCLKRPEHESQSPSDLRDRLSEMRPGKLVVLRDGGEAASEKGRVRVSWTQTVSQGDGAVTRTASVAIDDDGDLDLVNDLLYRLARHVDDPCPAETD